MRRAIHIITACPSGGAAPSLTESSVVIDAPAPLCLAIEAMTRECLRLHARGPRHPSVEQFDLVHTYVTDLPDQPDPSDQEQP
jgi:hypothetical protein